MLSVEEINLRKERVRIRFSEVQEDKSNLETRLEGVNAELFRLQGENRLLDGLLEEIAAAEQAVQAELAANSAPEADATEAYKDRLAAEAGHIEARPKNEIKKREN